ncbi:hypothetical protein MZM54_03620 [[Brevibacterium] frigoritolerans]|nr:hypothetical protein [Peribacillus frigoritolerans]
MKEVKISFNKQTWSNEGTVYKGCFSVTEKLYMEFKEYVMEYLNKYESQNMFSTEEMKDLMYLPSLEVEADKFTGERCVFLKLTQRGKFVDFLKEKGIKFNPNRAFSSFNYYLALK